MLKALDVGANYQPSRRSESWIKIKKCAPAARPPSLQEPRVVKPRKLYLLECDRYCALLLHGLGPAGLGVGPRHLCLQAEVCDLC